MTEVDLKLDIVDTERLLALAERPSVKNVLNSHLNALHHALARATSLAPATSSTGSSPLVKADASAAPTAAFISSVSGSSAVTFHAVKYGWEQDTNFVTVLIYELPGVGTVNDQVSCDFDKFGFDLIVKNLDGKAYRLKVPNLDKEIRPSECSYKVKKNSIEIKLRKAGQWDHWIDLKSKKGPEAKKKENEDPSAAIMDMMKDMYEQGDAQTRKIIGEAWTKSREEQARTAAGLRGLKGPEDNGSGSKAARFDDFSAGLGADSLDDDMDL